MSNRETIKHAAYDFFENFVQKYEGARGVPTDIYLEQIAALKEALQTFKDSLYLTIKESIVYNEITETFVHRVTNEKDGYTSDHSVGRGPIKDYITAFRSKAFVHFSSKYNIREADVTLVTSSGKTILGPTLSLEDRCEAEEFHRPEDEEPA